MGKKNKKHYNVNKKKKFLSFISKEDTVILLSPYVMFLFLSRYLRFPFF